MRRVATALLSTASCAGGQCNKFRGATISGVPGRCKAPSCQSPYLPCSLRAPSAWQPAPVPQALSLVSGRRAAAPRGESWRQLPLARSLATARPQRFGTIASASGSASGAAPAGQPVAGRGREFPDNVRVGVGVVVLRAGPGTSVVSDNATDVEVLMARRAKARLATVLHSQQPRDTILDPTRIRDPLLRDVLP